jgi:hypothetical protein
MESTRAKEEEVRKETADQLETFRRQQEEAEKASNVQEDSPPIAGSENWAAVPKKRKKGREGAIGGVVKLRRVSTTEKQSVSDQSQNADGGEDTTAGATTKVATAEASAIEPNSSAANDKEEPTCESSKRKSTSVPAESVSPDPKPPSPPAAGLGLAAYSSDEDD